MEAFESKGLEVNLLKTNLSVSGDITMDAMSDSNVDPCGVCSFSVRANSVLSLQCGNWIHITCARVKMAIPMF